MYQIDNNTAISTLPTPAAPGVNPNYFFTAGDPNSGVPATTFDSDFANAVMMELCNVITGAGLTLDKASQSQLLQAIEIIAQKDLSIYAPSTSAANTYTATLSPVPAAYTTGMITIIKFTNANTGAATLNLNSLGAKTITRIDGSALVAGDIQGGMLAILIYDGTNFQLINAYNKLQIQNDSFNFALCTTAANTYTATMSPAPTAYVAGMRISLLFTNGNTGAATINLNSLGAKNIFDNNGNAITSGMITGGMIADLRFDGTNFQLMNPAGIGIITSQIVVGSAVTLSSGVAKNMTSINVPAGKWKLYGNTFFTSSTATVYNSGISSTSVTLPDQSLTNGYDGSAAPFFGAPVPSQVVTPTVTTTYYLVCQANYGAGTATVCGQLTAERI